MMLTLKLKIYKKNIMNNNIHTKSPITRYLLVAAIFVVVAVVVKLITAEPAIETRTVKINDRTYAYQVREGEEQDTLTHMVHAYGNMLIANKMNKHCIYLTPLDTNTLDVNTQQFGTLLEPVMAADEALKQHIADIKFNAMGTSYVCDASGRAFVENYTHASRAIAAGFGLTN